MNEYGVSDLIYAGEIYDGLNHFDFDLDFYERRCSAARGQVLELCSGTGRLTIPIAKIGVPITGLDLSESMLLKAREKAKAEGVSVEFIQGDIRKFELGKRFGVIFIPFNSIQHMYSIEDVENVFSSVKKHLGHQGQFIFDIFNPSIDFMVSGKDRWYPVAEFTLKDGRRVSIEETCLYDSAGQVNRIQWKHWVDGRQSIEQLDMRCFYPLEMDALLKYNGFKIEHKFGDFEENPFQSKSKKQIYVCTLA